jgi:hypothetical protein
MDPNGKARKRQRGGLALNILLLLGFFGFIGAVAYSIGSRESIGTSVALEEEAFLRWQGRLAQISPEWVSASVERNPNEFSCLSSRDGACAGRGGLFLLFENKGSVLALSQRNLKDGVSVEDQGCDSFPSPQCPIRVESHWKPVCNGSHCENTRSFQLSVKVLRHVEGKPLEVWQKEDIVNPVIQLGRAAECQRGGGIWAEVECLTPDQASARQLASAPSAQASPQGSSLGYDAAPTSASEEVVEYECPSDININEERFTLERHPGGKGIVGVPAMNGCPDTDLFTFQCQAKFPASFPNEGQWVQVEAKMAPTCTAQ